MAFIFVFLGSIKKKKRSTHRRVHEVIERSLTHLRHLRADACEFGRVAGERFREVIVLFDAQRVHGANDLESDEGEAR